MNHFISAPTKWVPLGAESIRHADPAPNDAPRRCRGNRHRCWSDVLVLLQNVKAAIGCRARAFARRNRRVDHDFVAEHEIGALLRERDADVRIVRGELGEKARGDVNWFLPMDQIVRSSQRRGGPRRGRGERAVERGTGRPPSRKRARRAGRCVKKFESRTIDRESVDGRCLPRTA